MINQKSVLIGILISVVLLFFLGTFLGLFGYYAAVFIGALIASYLASGKIQLKVVEAGLHGIIVGIFTGVIYVLFTYAYSGFSKVVAGILIYFALVLIGGFIIVGALGGIIGILISVKSGNMGTDNTQITEQQEEKMDSSEKND